MTRDEIILFLPLKPAFSGLNFLLKYLLSNNDTPTLNKIQIIEAAIKTIFSILMGVFMGALPLRCGPYINCEIYVGSVLVKIFAVCESYVPLYPKSDKSKIESNRAKMVCGKSAIEIALAIASIVLPVNKVAKSLDSKKAFEPVI